MTETTPLIKATLNLRVGAGFDIYMVSALSTSLYRGSPAHQIFSDKHKRFPLPAACRVSLSYHRSQLGSLPLYHVG